MALRADGERGRQIRAAVALGRELLLEADAAAAAASPQEAPVEDAAAAVGAGGGPPGAAAEAAAGLGGPGELEASSSNGSSWELVERYPAAEADAGLRDVRRMVAGTLQV